MRAEVSRATATAADWRETIPHRGRLRTVRMLIVLLTLAAASVGYIAYQKVTAAPAAKATVSTAAVQRGPIASSVTAAGSVVATRQAKLSFTSSGRLKELLVQQGQTVSAGQALARLDTATLENKVAQAQSALKTVQINLQQLQTPATEAEIVAAQAAVTSAEAKLKDVQAGSKPAEIAAASAAVTSAQAKLKAVQAGSSDADLKAAEQSVVAATANLEKARADLLALTTPATDDSLASARVAMEKATVALQQAQGNYDQVAWRNDTQASSQGAALQQATLDYWAAQAAYNLKVAPPKEQDVLAAQKSVESAEASLASAQAKLSLLQAGPTEADTQSARSALASAQSQLSSLTAGPTAADVESARSGLASAQAQLATKAAAPQDTDIALAEEKIAQAELSLQSAQQDLEAATLVAPFGGVVSVVGANVGEQVGSGTAMVTLVDPTALRVDVNVDETDVTKMAVGKVAAVTFDAIPNQRFMGKVIAVAPVATVQSGVVTYQVSIGLDRSDRAIPGGLTANATIILEQKNNVLTVPSRAVKTQGKDKVVEVMVDGKAEARTVSVGMSNDSLTEITQGLSEGEQVVIPSTTTAASQTRAGGLGPVGGNMVVVGGGGPPPGR